MASSYEPEINRDHEALGRRAGISAEKQLRPASAIVSCSKKNLPEEISSE